MATSSMLIVKDNNCQSIQNWHSNFWLINTDLTMAHSTQDSEDFLSTRAYIEGSL